MDNSIIVIGILIVIFLIYMNYSNSEHFTLPPFINKASKEFNKLLGRKEHLRNSHTHVPNKKQYREHLDNITAGTPVVVAPTTSAPVVSNSNMAPPMNTVNENYATAVPSSSNLTDKIVTGSTQLTASDLLPKYDEANDFVKENPVSGLLKEQNFLISGYHMGINTVMQSNKIAYLDLRSAPPIPKQDVGPFLNSSYDSFGGSSARRYFEISST
jgi:hypothetical protein